jgi:hypothetical protein
MSWDHDTIEPVWQDAARWRPRFDATRRAATISRPLAYPADAPRGDPRVGHTLRAGLRAFATHRDNCRAAENTTSHRRGSPTHAALAGRR